jgi:hypothetical protein
MGVIRSGAFFRRREGSRADRQCLWKDSTRIYLINLPSDVLEIKGKTVPAKVWTRLLIS